VTESRSHGGAERQDGRRNPISERIQREIEADARCARASVGGAVARERLRDAIEAFELAERQEREIEADYEAWSLLLDQMKQADAAQASNLGQALAPAIASRFEALTQRRYENIQLTPRNSAQKVSWSPVAVQLTDRISVGTREQLSTLYRLALAEYLVHDCRSRRSTRSKRPTIRGWIGSAHCLRRKPASFRSFVFTCRPGDYLAADATTPKGKAVHRDNRWRVRASGRPRAGCAAKIGARILKNLNIRLKLVLESVYEAAPHALRNPPFRCPALLLPSNLA